MLELQSPSHLLSSLFGDKSLAATDPKSRFTLLSARGQDVCVDISVNELQKCHIGISGMDVMLVTAMHLALLFRLQVELILIYFFIRAMLHETFLPWLFSFCWNS